MAEEPIIDGPVGEKVNILIVDDRADKLLAHETILADLNQNLVRAKSGKEALRCLLKQDFAVILLDVNMPGMDGFEPAALIRTRQRSETTPIIFISAVNDTQTHEYDRRGLRSLALSYQRSRLEAVHPRHVHVQEDDREV